MGTIPAMEDPDTSQEPRPSQEQPGQELENDASLFMYGSPRTERAVEDGIINLGFPDGSDGKASACNAGDPGSIPGSGRSPGEGNGNRLQYSCL
ncbi:hypothetical protein MG293_000949 [Ovis ammon polii]|uniref:Uncharacterized protein n=1 Tax=Ovis ammon polii TaxID=230172 RepID=A0AAD4YHL5_OVIAM|nr:hypothetical protein MG293_000949 [Ovis ammon polii]